MKRSTNRILTTHVGSLPRPADLLEMNTAKVSGHPYDQTAWTARVKTAVLEVVRLQVESGVDIVNDGELSKSSWSSYVNERLGGFAESAFQGQGSLVRGRDKKAFQEFYDEYDRIQPFRTVNGSRWTDVTCTAPVSYKEQTPVQMDIENLKAAYAGVEAEEAFITAVAPGSIITRRINKYYPTEEAFLFAIAEAMRIEYKAIVDAGFLLQIDDPQLVTRYDMEDPPLTAEEYRKSAAPRVEALNHALADIPQERVRYHICWGGWHGPHTTDLPLKDIVNLLFRIRAGAYLIEAANARHEHEWRVWESVKLPAGKILIPGVVSHATNAIEHPELVADRILRFANLVGRENVIAGTDCGLGGRIHHQLVWAKLKALSEGARLATRQLWGRRL
ncbi:MAG TPA: cobalamin-independent methionine synthase II family protein [Methylomirabilota bacterium]|nr:cobalamin-independent methionine synthase II family protein [Methylomirabilota bacterium]